MTARAYYEDSDEARGRKSPVGKSVLGAWSFVWSGSGAAGIGEYGSAARTFSGTPGCGRRTSLHRIRLARGWDL